MTAETACTLIPQQLTDSPADPTVSELVARAKDGDKQAWDALVERYAPLIWSICRRHRLSRADADDVAQSVWVRLVDQLDRVRDPAALPGWLATTARRECLRVLCATQGPRATMYALDVESLPDERAGVSTSAPADIDGVPIAAPLPVADEVSPVEADPTGPIRTRDSLGEFVDLTGTEAGEHSLSVRIRWLRLLECGI